MGPYEILAPLGAGGMGEVYRARDTRLGREVALKVLPAEFSENPERRQRFEQEARAASALNHPNIVVVHDVGSEAGVLYQVSELVAGESLRAPLRRGPMRARRAIELAVQIAEGMAAAHAAGIVHRDLKPENLMVTPEGRVKILDFGLAKQAPSRTGAPSASEATATALGGTQPGAVLGTPGYMSPEQVRGEPADARSDIFSFGAVLYEMVAGRHAFTGDSTVETLNAILKEEPPDLPATLPGALGQVIRHCLEKDARGRFQSAQDLAFALRTLERESGSGVAPAEAPAQAPSRTHSRLAFAALVLLGAGLATGLWLGGRLARKEPPSFRKVTFGRGTLSGARFGTDGRTIVYSAAWQGQPHQIYLGRLESPESRPLGLEGATLLSISQTGELAVALEARSFFVDHFMGKLARVPLSGGAPRVLLSDVSDAEWAPDGENLAVAHLVGAEMRLEYPIGEVLYRTSGWISSPRFSPNGDRLAFLDHSLIGDNRGSVAVVDLAGNKQTLSGVFNALEGLCWAPSGAEIWFGGADRGGWPKSILGVTLSGRQRPVLRTHSPIRLVDARPDGRLLLAGVNVRSEMLGVLAGEKQEHNLAWLDQPLPRDLSADGKTLLFLEQGEATGSEPAVYLRKTDGTPAIRLGSGGSVALSPDGKWALARAEAGSGLTVLPTAEGQPVQLPLAGLARYGGAAWLPDNRHIILSATVQGRGSRLWKLSRDGGKPQPLSPEGLTLMGNQVSPDGKFAAAIAPDGSAVLYPLDGGESRPLRGIEPGEQLSRWSADGRFLYVYRSSQIPSPVYRLEPTSGKRELLRSFAPADSTGVFRLGRVLLDDQGASAVFGFTRILSELFLAEGVGPVD